jgi:putative colanic acid biosynthesis acetyltransferase WcaF
MTPQTDLSRFDNSWYHPGPLHKRALWYMVHALFFRSGMPVSALKVGLLRMFGSRVGKGVVIKPHVRIKYPWKLEIGDYTWIGEESWIDNLDQVSIGSHCCISQGAMLLCGNHNYRKSAFDLMVKPITLEQGAWVGARATVCQGVTMASHSVLSVGSVLTRDAEPYAIYQGVPAIRVKTREISA